MIIHTGTEKLDISNAVVTVGIFDGVHRGHRALLDYLVSYARRVNGESVVVTFDKHPRMILSDSKSEIFYLSTLDEKKRLLADTGINHLVILEFNHSLAGMDAGSFVKRILVGKIGIKHLIVGYDHHFGKNREGSYTLIRGYAERSGFNVEQIPGIASDHSVISSTLIREALSNGNLRIASDMLGYEYSLAGKVIRGKGLGRDIGFPTANIEPDDMHKLVPGSGVYAVRVSADDRLFLGMLSIGTNPTVNKDPDIRSIEVNIFDFEGDLYSREIRVYFTERLRDEIRFDSIGQLKEQMKSDRLHALKVFSST
ncbi:MAG TPA: bifunctional riboflavin kinase/FAD synthetase [Bacteroidales bacterium]|nr:bifunctional riboflavin kinase/FAD synthetase [Bacteroidales bacterium]HNR42021.1 bifunctional riboflavin kinase/FAD synthetase [Bacteroidales bacterium]HPM17409.1 bifunctional riboflavin kinase/FAD synthetase [Bacteroidales bacterium]HQG77001.1 bifunctional riboflavin kinase/FAD synthetase [Bacteroidales bacterium]